MAPGKVFSRWLLSLVTIVEMKGKCFCTTTSIKATPREVLFLSSSKIPLIPVPGKLRSRLGAGKTEIWCLS